MGLRILQSSKVSKKGNKLTDEIIGCTCMRGSSFSLSRRYFMWFVGLTVAPAQYIPVALKGPLSFMTKFFGGLGSCSRIVSLVEEGAFRGWSCSYPMYVKYSEQLSVVQIFIIILSSLQVIANRIGNCERFRQFISVWALVSLSLFSFMKCWMVSYW